MAFPASATDLEVCFAYGANLASDLTTLTYSPNLALTHVRPRILIKRGRIGDATLAQPTSIEYGLKNPSGVFSPRNISGPHYGQLRRNTPVRVRLDPGTGLTTRGIAYMPDWPVRWTGPDIDDHIDMQASGSLRRLGVGSEVKSALKRSITALAVAPTYYWPCEDGSGSTAAVSGIAGGSSLTAVNTAYVSFASNTRAPGSAPMVSFTAYNDGSAVGGTGNFSSIAIPGLGSTGFSIAMVFTADLASTPVTSIRNLFKVNLTGGTLSYVYLSIYATTASGVPYTTYGMDVGTSTGVLENNFNVSPSPFDGALHTLLVTFAQVGADVNATAYIDGVRFALDFGLQAGKTLGTPTTLTFNEMSSVSFGGPTDASNNVGTKVGIGHVCLWAGGSTPTELRTAATGYTGELAAVRVARLCAEESIPIDVTAGTSEAMGPQLVGAILDLLRQCEESDEGTLIERRTGKLGFDPRSSRYNKAVAMTVNYTTQVAELLPSDDDRDLLNYITVSRIGGSFGTDQQTTGPLGTDKTTGVDRYPDAPSRSLSTDTQTVHRASYLVAKGTVDEPRYVVGVNLRSHPELVTQWLACDIGSRIQVTNPPAIQTGPAPLDLALDGYEELLDGVEWYVTLYCSPYRINEVLQIETGTANRSRIAAGVSTTDLAYSASATSLSVTSASVRWIDSATYAAKFPIVIDISGEVMTCTAIAGTGLTQTFTVTRGLHGVTKALPITSAVQIWRPPCIAL